MTCESARKRLQEDCDQRLESAERPALEAHLADCAACRAYGRGLAQLTAPLATLAAAEAAPAELWARLGLDMAAPSGPGGAAAQRQDGAAIAAPVPAVARREAGRRGRRRWAWVPISAAAAVLLAVGLSQPLHRPVDELALADAEPGAVILDYFGPEADDAVW